MEMIYWGESQSVASFDKKKFEEFLRKPPEEIRRLCIDKKGRLKHIINAEHFDLSFLQAVCSTARAARQIAKLNGSFLKNLLPAKSILNYFNQASSRTFLSFSMAEARLGMLREEVRDLKTSSFVKGETEKDALRTISSYVDAIVCRHPSDLYGLFALWVMKNSDREIPIINAGSGKQEHPTQGILDYYTIHESFQGNVDGLSIAFVGDCLRGRTVHSLAKILSLHQNITLHFVAPASLQIDSETAGYITEKGTAVHKTTGGLKEIIPEVDVVYMTRVQDEHGGKGEYDPALIFTEELLSLMKEDAILMHPMPKREEIDPAIDYRKREKKVMYWREQRNGMWARVALIAYLFEVDHLLRQEYENVRGVTL